MRTFQKSSRNPWSWPWLNPGTYWVGSLVEHARLDVFLWASEERWAEQGLLALVAYGPRPVNQR